MGSAGRIRAPIWSAAISVVVRSGESVVIHVATLLEAGAPPATPVTLP